MTWWYIWLPASTVLVWSTSRLARYWMTRSARLRVALLWQGLAQAFIDAKPLRQQCLKLTRKTYKAQRKQSRTKHRASMGKVVDKYRRRKRVLKALCVSSWPSLKPSIRLRLTRSPSSRDRELQSIQETFEVAQPRLQAQCEQNMHGAEERQRRLVEENDARHLGEWQKLCGWQKACDDCNVELQAIGTICASVIFLPGKNWPSPSANPAGSLPSSCPTACPWAIW